MGSDKVTARAQAVAERAVEGIDMEPVSVSGMEKIRAAIAEAFALGYAAAIDDQVPARALVDSPRRKR